jgi:hypothetical protein
MHRIGGTSSIAAGQDFPTIAETLANELKASLNIVLDTIASDEQLP